MRHYLFYPGCSMEASALEYKTSMEAVFDVLGAEVTELDEWTCCGASVASVMSDLLGLALPARNLAIAEKTGCDEMLVGCSACFISFQRAANAAADAETLAKINRVLEVEDLTYGGRVRTRHMLDVLANDFGKAAIAARVQRPLAGLKVAPYYGCQTVRPFSTYDDGQHPNSMEPVLEALGATIHHHLHEAACCGTALLTTKPEVGLRIAGEILADASGADCIATVCPMCHMNLDSYQDKASKLLGKTLRIPIVFLPQLMGVAFGLSEDKLLFRRHVVPVDSVFAGLPAVVGRAPAEVRV